jgi:hypothetical protein
MPTVARDIVAEGSNRPKLRPLSDTLSDPPDRGKFVADENVKTGAASPIPLDEI